MASSKVLEDKLTEDSEPGKENYFRREMNLLNYTTTQNEEPDLSKLSISEEGGDEECHAYQNGPLREEFLSVQCPFTWSKIITCDKIEETLSSYDSALVGEPREWNTFCINLYLTYGNARVGKMDKVFEYIKLCQEQLSNGANDDFYNDIFDGLDHALKATMVHIYFLKGDAEKADEIMAKIIPLKDLSGPCQGALLAVQATIIHDFDIQLKEEILPMIQAVIKLDPDEKGSRRGVWYFMAGKLIGQLRRINYRAQIPSKEELQLLERAILHNPFPISLATLAESYREAAVFSYQDRDLRGDKRHIDRFNNESRRLLIAAIEMNDNNAGTLRRCGNGLVRLPPMYQDIPLAKKCLEKAISLDPNNSPAYQALGTLMERNLNNLSEAVKYYQRSVDTGNVLAGLAAMRVRFQMDSQYNPLKDCDEYFEKGRNERNIIKAAFLVAKGEYYLFVEQNLILAAKEWEKAIELAPETDTVTKHWKIFKERNKWSTKGNIINVYECLKNEIRRAPPVSSTDQAFLNHILEICEKKA